MSIERRKVLKAFGARLLLTDGALGMKGALDRAEEIAESEPDRYVLLQQFKNPANPQIHFDTTGPEIWNDTDGGVDVLVAGIGTGGTITGISRYLKSKKGKAVVSVGVEPDGSPVITQTRERRRAQARSAQDPGHRRRIHPRHPGPEVVDRVEQVTNEESMDMARRLAREEGILSGISCGAAAAAAVRLAKEPEMEGKTIVVILPDSGERYLSTVLFEGLFRE